MPGLLSDRAPAVGLVLAASLLTACGGKELTARDICDDPEEYQAAVSGEPLEIPPRLDDPPSSNRFEIPNQDEAGKYPDGRPCLERPPDYFAR